jgi:hypothetical protein
LLAASGDGERAALLTCSCCNLGDHSLPGYPRSSEDDYIVFAWHTSDHSNPQQNSRKARELGETC